MSGEQEPQAHGESGYQHHPAQYDLGSILSQFYHQQFPTAPHHDDSHQPNYLARHPRLEDTSQELVRNTSYTHNQHTWSCDDSGPRHDATEPIQQRPLGPSSEYLAKSLEPSTHIQEPTRKLLILDLNGTLVYRQKTKPMPRQLRHLQLGPHHIWPRPYLPSFRSYLFHPLTRKWLDVMIWSSAQPHSVKSMVEACFPDDVERCPGEKDSRFIAVWARDTLGLSKADYSRKTQTTKDLDKVWSQIQVPIPSPPSSPSHEPCTNDAGSPVHMFRHSPETTLLLDDSPLKAVLQPWNHVCIKEYDALARQADLSFLKRSGHVDAEETEREVLKDAAGNLSKDLLDVNDAEQEFESTLIAIIGILEDLKHESNVAGWLRDRGLWVKEDKESKVEQPLSRSPDVDSAASAKTLWRVQSLPTPTPTPATPASSRIPFPLSYSEVDKIDIPGLSFLNQRRKRKLSDDESETERSKRLRTGGDSDLVSGFPSLPSSSPSDPGPHSTSEPSAFTATAAATITYPIRIDPASTSIAPVLAPAGSHPSPTRSLANPVKAAVQNHKPPQDHLPPPSTPHGSDSAPQIEETFWFLNLPSYRYWLCKGRETLKRLGIEEVVGIHEMEDLSFDGSIR